MPRPILDEAFIHPAIRGKIAAFRQTIVTEVMAAIRDHEVVVVGMSMNPFPARACRALDDAGQPYKYLEYGNYLNGWRSRSALKMWTGWPTFPMIFVRGILIGGYTDLQALINSGEFKQMVAPRRPARR